MDVVVDVLAHGRYIDQARITGSVDGRVVFAAVGSTATGREGGLTGTGPTMPSVAPPEESQPRVSSHRSSWSTGEPGHHRVVQILDAAPTSGVEHEPGRLTMWSRIIDESTTTAAKLGFLADMVPLAICDAAGVAGAGTSLDNSLRVGHLVDCEWVLMDLRGVVAHDGYGHGDVLLWSPDGVLLATGSQTAKLFSFERFFSA